MKILLSTFLLATLGCNQSIQSDEVLEVTHEQAINNFVQSSFPGWTVKGIVDDSNCAEPMTGCHLNITNQMESKVVTVSSDKFKKADGNYYWVVFEDTKKPEINQPE